MTQWGFCRKANGQGRSEQKGKWLRGVSRNFPNMGKEIVNQVQEVQRVPYRTNPKRNMLRHI